MKASTSLRAQVGNITHGGGGGTRSALIHFFIHVEGRGGAEEGRWHSDSARGEACQGGWFLEGRGLSWEGQIVFPLTSSGGNLCSFLVQLITAVVERLMDPVEAVRAAACTALCAAATADPTAVPRAAITGGGAEEEEGGDGAGGVCGRLRDKKPSVRAAAAEGLVSVFRSRCSSGTEGECFLRGECCNEQ